MTALDAARLLIVDDSPANVLALRGMLASDYAVAFATSGAEALGELARQPYPDLILLDVAMPEMDGYAVCAALKADAATREIPVIFVTARNDPESESRALAAGGVDFLHKPVAPPVLRARVGVHLALRRQTQALALANAELARHRDRLEDLVQARTRALAAALDEAQSASRAKSAFLATVSHELRTPINHIVGLGYLLRKRCADPQSQTHLARLQQSSGALLALIDTVLQYAASESETPTVASLAFAPAPLIARVIEQVQPLAEAKGIALVQEIDPALPAWLTGDPERLGQILGQLLDNAIKFSATGPATLRVRVLETRDAAATLRFAVEDRGIGISPERQATLFGAFEQGDSSPTRRYGGIGLGLALCRRLAALMGGELGLRSVPGEGSAFWLDIRLPLAAAPAEPPSAPDGLDPERRAQALLALEALLVEGDWAALLLWEDERAVLAPALGARADAFGEALERLDLEEALRRLREAAAPAPPGTPA